MPIQRKSIRLAPKNYLGERAYFITICCDNRQTHLSYPTIARTVLKIMFDTAATHSFHLHAYCIMPDHAHILVQGRSPTSNALEFARIFKLRSAFSFKRSEGMRLWEFSYYDHILRNPCDIHDVASYIWWNPVRKKLCERPEEYPFSGSKTIQWMKVAGSGTEWSPPWRGRPV